MRRFARLLFILLIPPLTACSLYESDGRKFLEKNAFQYTGASLALQGCGYAVAGRESDWLLAAEDDKDGIDVGIYTSEREDFSMRVHTLGATGAETFACTYKFTSAQEMVERTEEAVGLTLLHLRLGEFAFRPLSHVK